MKKVMDLTKVFVVLLGQRRCVIKTENPHRVCIFSELADLSSRHAEEISSVKQKHAKLLETLKEEQGDELRVSSQFGLTCISRVALHLQLLPRICA